MIPLLASPPPISVDARVVIAAIGFGLSLALARSLAGSPTGLRRSIACFAAALGLAAFVLEGDIGVVSFLGGLCCGGLAYVPRVRAMQRPRPERSTAALGVGPLPTSGDGARATQDHDVG